MSVLGFLCAFGLCQADSNSSEQTIVIREGQAHVEHFSEFQVKGDLTQFANNAIVKVKCEIQDDLSSKCENGLKLVLKGS